VRRFGRTAIALLIAAAAAAAGVLLISGSDGGGEQRAGGTGPRPPSAPAHEPGDGHRSTNGHGARSEVQRAVEESGSPRLDQSQRRVARVARDYVAALDARNGERVCALFVPGGLGQVDFPRRRGSCARSVEASIGYRDPRGFPVYESSRLARIPGVSINGPKARVTATTVTRFADNREPSVEDDVIYLQSRSGRWLIAKPSATLYRAIGVGNIPPQVLAPP
jgi:hypothetical protein